MRNIISFVLFLCVSSYCMGQSSIRPYVGLNVSSATQFYPDSINIDNFRKVNRANSVLPEAGIDIYFNIGKTLSLITGLSASWMGYRKTGPSVDHRLGLDNSTRLGSLRVPLAIKVSVFKNFSILAGGTFNYIFRKNEEYRVIEGIRVESIFSPYKFGVIGGVEYSIDKFTGRVNYFRSVSNLYDSKIISPVDRAYGTYGGIQFSLGYMIEK